jgi:hypothetical protein
LLLIEPTTSRFEGTYQPEERDTEGFTFILNKLWPKYRPILFRLDLWDDKGARKLEMGKTNIPKRIEGSRWNDAHWDWACLPNEEKLAERPVTPTEKPANW